MQRLVSGSDALVVSDAAFLVDASGVLLLAIPSAGADDEYGMASNGGLATFFLTVSTSATSGTAGISTVEIGHEVADGSAVEDAVGSIPVTLWDGGTSSAVLSIDVPPSAATTGPYTGDEGASISFADASTDSVGTVASWSWDFGDGTTSTQENPSKSYADNGAFTVTLTVTDSGGLTDTATTTATIANVAPSVTATVPATGFVGSSVSVSGSFTDPGSADTHTVLWDFGDGGTATSLSASKTWSAAGTFTVTLTVTDDDGGAGTATTTIQLSIPNLPPVASPGGPYTGDEGSAVALTDGSTDVDGTVVSWLWDLGDGTTSTQQNPTKTWVDDGTYTVSLTVTDDDGATNTVSTTATVSNVAPIASATIPATGLTGTPITFVGGLTDVGTADTHTFLWDFGDGATDTASTTTHGYATAGTYTVTLTVTDDGGGVGTDSGSIVISAPNADPVADPGGPYTGDEGSAVTLTDGSTDSDGTVVSWLWDFGDSTTSTAQNPSVTYAEDGTYTVSLTVTDDDGASNTATTTATIGNVAASVSATVPATGITGDPVAFTGSFTDPGTTDTHTFKWSFGDTTDDTASLTPSHTYSAAGTYTVTLEVTDDDGALGSDTGSIVISDPNDAPGQPVPVAPVDATVSTTMPDLEWVNVVDPDGDPVTYTVEVWDDLLSTLVADASDVAEADADNTIWTLDVSLDDGDYVWRVQAVDDSALAGEWSVDAEFTVLMAGDDDDATGDDDDATGDDDDSAGDDDDATGDDDDSAGDDDDSAGPTEGCDDCQNSLAADTAPRTLALLLVLFGGLVPVMRRRR